MQVNLLKDYEEVELFCFFHGLLDDDMTVLVIFTYLCTVSDY